MTSRRRRRRQAGFTLIELMISLLISTLLVIMILSIFARMSFAYREQQQVVGLQQTLSAARTALEHDARQAGLMLSQGFTISADLGVNRHSPVRVVNRTTGPDDVGFYYADPSAQALVVAAPVPTTLTVTVDDADNFAVGDLVVLSTPDTVSFSNPISNTDAKIARFTACVVKIATIVNPTITFETTGEWGNGLNAHCSNPIGGVTMMYRFIGHFWRIDTSRPDLAPLQLEPTGNLVSTQAFADQAYGFTDLQAATYFYDADATDTNDPDTDGDRDWESSTDQDTLTAPTALLNNFVPPLMMSLSLVSRTSSNVEGVFTANTPELVDPANVTNNTVGDRVSLPLPSTSDPMLFGHRIYRFVTFQIDLRNMGIGR